MAQTTFGWEPISRDQGDSLIDGLARQNLLLSELIDKAASDATSTRTLREIHNIVRAGDAARAFDIGDQINVSYNDGSRDYVLPFDIVHFEDVELEDGETVPGMFIQCHYAMQSVQFDQNEAFYVVPAAGLPAGTYHFTFGSTWGSNVISGKSYQFTLANSYAEGDQLVIGTTSNDASRLPDTAPSTWRVRAYKGTSTVAAGLQSTPTEIVTLSEGTGGTDLGSLTTATKYSANGINNLHRAGYGYNRYAHSAMHQFLNSPAAADAWWTPMNPFDRRPDQLATMRGFMAGFDEEFLSILKPIKVVTALNTISDSEIGTTEPTYDTFFPASLQQEYIVPQLANVEGTSWTYWKRRLGLTSPQTQGAGGINANHIRYAYDNHASAQYCRLRSAYRGNANVTWLVYSTGYAYTSNASYANRCAPACVIC